MATQADQGCSIVGSFVWVEDPEEAWMDGEVVEVNGEDIKVNCVSGKTGPPILAQKLFIQIFSYIIVQLFNSLLLRRECCTFSNGEYVKAGLAELELWCDHAKEEDCPGMNLNTQGKLLDSWLYTRNREFPMMKLQMTFAWSRVLNSYTEYVLYTGMTTTILLSVSPDVISSMKILTDDSNDDDSDSFLLDDNNFSIPFSADDLSSSLHERDFSDAKPAADLLENPAFHFLQD